MKKKKIQSKTYIFSTVLLTPASRHQASHTSLALHPVPSKNGRVRVGLTDTAMLITMWLSAMEKARLRVLCTLRRPLSVASCSLKAYGLK